MSAPLPKVSLRFAWFDCWVGWFWDRRRRHLFICLFPMLPLCLRFPWRRLCDVGGCQAPATHVCRRPGSVLFGDPLCQEHSRGSVLDCPRVAFQAAAHVPLPAAEWWYFEDAG